MLGQEREVIVKESEDKEIEVQNLSLHEMSIASSTSVEAVENDGNLLSNEKRNQSSIPSRTTSECSSCFRSPTDNLVENDLFSGSGKGHTSSVYQGEDAHSYNSSSDMSDSMSTTQSVSSSDDQTDTESSVRSSTNSFQCFDNGNVTTMPNSAHPPSENPQVLSSSEGAAKVEKCPEMMMLENTHGSFADSTASDDRKLAGNYDTTSPDAPTQSDLLSQHAASSVEVLHTSDEGSYVIDTSPKPADPNPETTSVKGDVTAVNPTLVDTQNTVTGIGLADVIGTKANVTDTKSDITNSYPDVTDVGIDVTDGNPEVTDTQPNVRGKGPDDPKTNHDVTDPNINVTDPNINVHFVRNSEKSDTSTTYTDGSRNSVASRTSRSGSQSSTPDQESVLAGISPDQESVPAGISSCAPSASTHHDHCRTTGDSSTTEHLQQSEPEDGESESPSQATNVETEKCTLCKENVPVNELVTIPLDVAELIERKLLLCWRSGICFNHPNLFLAVCHRPLSNTVVVESAVSPSPLGRRLLTFVVDHLDTLIKEWYPGLLLSYGAEPTVRRLIPCRLCEKSGIPKPHVFTFDFCVTHYSMGNFVKCPRHEVSIQDIAPDVVLQDIDADLLLDEEEIEYETTDANKIGDGAFGKVYRGSCRGKDAAIKEYLTPTGEEDAMKRYCEVRKELNVLRRVGQHPYLINLIGVCLRPFRLVLELAVQGSLATALFNPNFLFDRVVVYRMIYQVAEALSFLHSLNVIYRDLKAENVLVMSYNEKDDANIKLTDFGTATFQFSEGLLALEGTPGYHAPEMLEEFSKRTGYDSKVDVFSLAMLIYGFITRRQPFYNINSSAEINRLISSGKKPDYDDVMAARIGLFTLTLLMEKCMHYNPYMRPNSSVVAAQVRSLPFQILLGVIALPCPQSVRHACVVEATRELWVAVDDKATNVVLVYELSRMCIKKKFTVNRIRSHNPRLCLQVNCMHVTTTSVLIGLRGDLDVVTVHDIATYELKAKIPLPEPVFCLSSNDRYIFLGMSGGVFRVIPITGDGKPETVEVSDSEPISCMVAVDKFLWLTARKCIHIFYTEEGESTRAFELNSVRFNSSNSPVSHAVLSADKTAIWCVSKGDSIVTGWDVAERQKLCEIDCKSVLSRISSQDKPLDPVEVTITCVLPALDTVWIGTGGGMLLILDAQSGELITSMQLFDDHVRTLTLVPGPGPCSTEKCYVVVSGKNLQETALSRGQKVVCRLDQEVIKEAPGVQTPTKVLDKTKRKAKKTTFYRAKSPESDSQKPDVEDGGVNSPRNGGLLLFFEVLPANVLRRVEARS